MDTPDPSGNGHQPTPDPDNDRMLTPAQVAEILGGNVTAGTVVRRRRSWGLPAHKVGRELRFRESDVHAWIRSRRD